jgi:hypothetical protein
MLWTIVLGLFAVRAEAQCWVAKMTNAPTEYYLNSNGGAAKCLNSSTIPTDATGL